MKFSRIILAWILLAFLASACVPIAPEASPRQPGVTPLLETQTSSPSPLVPPPFTASPAVSPTLVRTATPAPTASPTLSPTPTLHPMSIAAMRQGSYPGSDIVLEQTLDPGSNYQRYIASYRSQGLKIYGLLTFPQAEMPPGGWPAIVFNHGYIPPEEYRTTERYVAYVDALAKSGYVVFRIDYRGHDRSEGVALGAYGDPGYTVDVLNAAASLRRLPQVNPQRIGMWGHSMGGFLTLRAMVIDPGIRVGVIWAGVVASYPDMATRWHREDGPTPTSMPGARRWRRDWMELYGTPEQNPTLWSSISANSFLKDLSGPLQLHHGGADDTVPLEFSVDLAQQIKAVGGTVELYTYANDNHNLSESFSLAMYRTIAFFNHFLKDQP